MGNLSANRLVLEPQQNDWFVEETVLDSNGELERYQVVYIGENVTDCCDWMTKAETSNRLECWNKLFAECDHGYAPIAWRDKAQAKVMRRMAAIFV